MSSDIKDFSIHFPDEFLVTSCAVRDLGSGEYELLDHAGMSGSAMYGDTIRAEIESPGQLRFVEVTKKSEFEMLDYVFSNKQVVNRQLRELQETLNKLGVFWLRDFRGRFICFVSSSQKEEAKRLIERVCI